MKKGLRRIGKGLLIFLGSLVLLLVVAVALLLSPFGAERVRAFAQEKLNESLAGRLEFGSLDLRRDGLLLQDVKLFDPSGDLVASIAEVELELKLWPLTKRRVHVEQARLLRPQLYIEQDEQGTNLQRALESTKPDQPEDPQQRSFSVVVEDFSIREGSVSFEQQQAEGLLVVMNALAIDSSFRVLEGGESLEAQVKGTASLEEPLAGPVTLALEARGEGQARRGNVDLSLAGAQLTMSGVMNGMEELALKVQRLHVPPEVARAFAPDFPLQVPLDAHGEASLALGIARVDLEGGIGSADFSLSSVAEPQDSRVNDLSLTLTGANFAEWLEDGPVSDVDLRLKAQGAGSTLENLVGTMSLDLPPSELSGETLGPITLRARADHGTYYLEEAQLEAPGVSLVASGQGSRERLEVRADLKAGDLGKFGRTVGSLFGGLPVSGRGELSILVDGPLASPTVHAQGDFPLLAYAENRIEGLHLTARAEDPRELEGVALTLGAKSATLGTTKLRDTALTLSTEEGLLSLQGRTRGDVVAGVDVRAHVDEDRRGARIDALTLSYPEATWKLTQPARVRLEGEALAVQDLELVSGKQKLALSVEKRDERISGNFDLRAFDLARLPSFAFDEELALSGRVNASLELSGSVGSPAVAGDLRLEDVQYEALQAVDLSLTGRFSKEHAKGKLTASAGPARVDGTFDLPIDALLRGRRETVAADLAFHEVDLEKLRDAFELEQPMSGTVRGELSVSGYADDPKLYVNFLGKQLTHPKVPASDVQLVAKSDTRTKKLEARVEVTTLGRTSFVEVQLPWTLGRLMRNPPTASQALRASLQLEAKVERFPLPLLYTSDTMQKLVLGEVSADVKLRGSLDDPRGKASVRVDGLTTGDAAPISLVLESTAVRRRIETTLKGTQNDQEILDLTATLLRGLSGIRSTRSLQRLPIRVEGRVGPVGADALQNLAGRLEDPRGDPYPRLRGTIEGSFEATGTLGSPTAHAELTVKALGSDKSEASGDVHLTFDHREGKNALELRATSKEVPGELNLTASAPYPLGYRPRAKPPALDRVPFDVQLKASGLDLGFLSGLHPMLLGIGGAVNGHLEATGTLATPDVNGRLEWTEGRIQLAGFGEYEDVHLLLSGTQDRIALEDLSASAGKGRASVELLAERRGEAWRLTAKSNLREFPLISENQLVATVSLEAEAQGSATRELINFPSVRIDEAHIELPTTERKELQALDAAERVLFVRHGEPIEGQEELLAWWQGTMPEGQAVGGAGAAGAEAPSAQPSGMPVLRARIDAPRNIWLRGEDLNVEVGLEQGFRVQVEEETRVFGTVVVLRGHVEVLSRRFELQSDSSIRFTGPLLEPLLDVTATHENTREDVVVTLHVTGQGEDLQIRPSSDPPLPETEIYTLLATGRRSLEPGSGGSGSTAGAASSVLGSVVAGQLKKVLGEALPLDVFSVEAGDEGLGGATVEAGTYLGDSLYFGITTQLGADPMRRENQNAVQLEYQLGRRWSLDAEYGDARQGYIDLIWSKDY